MIRQKLFNIQQELKSSKECYNEFGKFNYRNLESILADVKPILKKYNCIITFNDEIVNVGTSNYIKSNVILTDIEDGDSFSVAGWAREDENKAGMSNGQMTGCASSYSRKYGICGLFAINEEKDLDALDNRTNKQPTNTSKEPQKDKKTLLTEFCQAKTSNGFNRDEVVKFFKYFEKKCENWKGTMDFNALWQKWNQPKAA